MSARILVAIVLLLATCVCGLRLAEPVRCEDVQTIKIGQVLLLAGCTP
jgi:hypothetical protein